MSDRFLSTVLLVALLAMSPAAQATAEASLSLTEIHIGMFDAAGSPIVSLTGRSAADVQFDVGGVSSRSHLNSTTFAAPVWATLPGSATNSATAWMLGDPYGFGATAHVDASDSAAPDSRSQASIWFADPALLSTAGFDFVLASHAELVVSVVADGYAYSDRVGDEALAGVFMHVDAATSAGPVHESSSWSVQTDGLPPGVLDQGRAIVSLVFVNPESTALEGTLNCLFSAVATSSVAEPAPAGLLLAGAVLVLARGRGRFSARRLAANARTCA